MTERFRLTLAQLNATVGDLTGNAALARRAWDEGREAGADLVALPEMFITGYQTQDLVLKPAFQQAAIAAIEALARECADGPALAIGGPALEGVDLHNAYYILQGGRIAARVFKHHLPNEDVFDEKRLFRSGAVAGPYAVNGVRIGSPICEDAWYPDVAETLAETGAEILLVPNGSPHFREKMAVRQNHMVARVIETGLPLVYLNLLGGQDDQVFDGGSFVLNPGGTLALQLPMFEEAIAHVDFERGADGWQARPAALAHMPDDLEQDYAATVLALRDYLRKTGFGRVVLGLSGGVDSAIVATIAADALGPENVRCVMLPSEYTAPESLEDARAVAEALGCPCDHLPISRRARGHHRHARAALRGACARCRRGEHPVAAARAAVDGAQQQVRRDAPDHRQQVRGGCRVFDHLRRHGGRLQPDQGPLQDAGLRALPLAQRQSPRVDEGARGGRDPAPGDRETPQRRACGRPEGQRLAARLPGARLDPRDPRR